MRMIVETGASIGNIVQQRATRWFQDGKFQGGIDLLAPRAPELAQLAYEELGNAVERIALYHEHRVDVFRLLREKQDLIIGDQFHPDSP